MPSSTDSARTIDTTPAARRTTWPGPRSKALFDEEQQYIAPGTQTIALLSQLAVEKGEGCRLTDADGNTYLDFNVGVFVGPMVIGFLRARTGVPVVYHSHNLTPHIYYSKNKRRYTGHAAT